MTVISAKAVGPNEYSGAIVVSFYAHWLEVITSGRPKAVLRKRVPRTHGAGWIYLYVNSPVGQLVGRARIKAINTITLETALNRTRDLCLEKTEIGDYFKANDSVGMYNIGKIELTKAPVSLSDIRERLFFYPPQSFMFLSQPAREIIDRMARFRK